MTDFVEEVFNNHYLEFEHLKKAYYAEIDLLGSMSAAGTLQQCLLKFKDYPAWLHSQAGKKRSLKNLEKISGGSRIVSADVQSKPLRNAMHMAHLAACVELFNGYSFLEKDLTQKALRLLVSKHLEQYRNLTPAQLNPLFLKFHTLDAVRTMQILRGLGLVTISTADIRLLGLGVGPGIKDLQSLHMAPSIETNDTSSGKCLTFHSRPNQYHDAVIFESDPQYRDSFMNLTSQPINRVVAINGDSITETESLGELLTERGMLPRNFVSLLRIDHRMLPDVKRFLRAVLQQTEEGSDLVITMGQGHSSDQFQARMKKIREIFNILSRVGMKPVIIKLHTDKMLKGGIFQQAFGTREITTFQILHCKLSPKLVDQI